MNSPQKVCLLETIVDARNLLNTLKINETLKNELWNDFNTFFDKMNEKIIEAGE